MNNFENTDWMNDNEDHDIIDTSLAKPGPSKINKWGKKNVDWDRLEQEYRTGQLSVVELSSQFGISVERIRQKAHELGWSRDLRGAVRDETHNLLLGTAENGSVREGDVDTVLMAAQRAVAVIKGHRERLGRLGALADSLLIKLEAIVAAKNEQEFAELRSSLLGRSESVFDALVKLTGIISKTIPLERQAFDLNDDRELKNLSDEALIRRACGDDVVDRLNEE